MKKSQNDTMPYTNWRNTTFYVVYVPGPAVVGLPKCEKLKLVTIYINGVMTKPHEQIGFAAKPWHLDQRLMTSTRL